MDSILRGRLESRLYERARNKSQQSHILRRANSVITDRSKAVKTELQQEFEECIGSYIMLGGSDIYSEFRETIQMMRGQGINANAGLAVIHFGEYVLANMEKLEMTSQRNGEAWNFLLDPVLHAYTVSKELQNELYNGNAHKEFEERLVKLGLIEKARDSKALAVVKPSLKSKIKSFFSSFGSKDDRDDMKQPILLESAQLNNARNMFINTGAVPLGYKFDKKTGELRKETGAEEMQRRTKANINLEEQRRRAREFIEREQKQQIMIERGRGKQSSKNRQPTQNSQGVERRQELRER